MKKVQGQQIMRTIQIMWTTDGQVPKLAKNDSDLSISSNSLNDYTGTSCIVKIIVVFKRLNASNWHEIIMAAILLDDHDNLYADASLQGCY